MLIEKIKLSLVAVAVVSACVSASDDLVDGKHGGDRGYHSEAVPDAVITRQRANLDKNTRAKGFGPQAPRDLSSLDGLNDVEFARAPHRSKMRLCDIHFHKNAEHKGGEFRQYAGNGDGHGYLGGWVYSGPALSHSEMEKPHEAICPSQHGNLFPGDTIEVHYVYSSVKGATLGHTLNTCLSPSVKNPQLRVEAQVFVLVNDNKAADFIKLTKIKKIDGKNQAINIPANTGNPIHYEGSTTGPKYNEVASPFQVSWSVRPKVMKVNIHSVGKWCKGNVFDEDHAHGVRNIIKNKLLLSTIKKQHNK